MRNEMERNSRVISQSNRKCHELNSLRINDWNIGNRHARMSSGKVIDETKNFGICINTIVVWCVSLTFDFNAKLASQPDTHHEALLRILTVSISNKGIEIHFICCFVIVTKKKWACHLSAPLTSNSYLCDVVVGAMCDVSVCINIVFGIYFYCLLWGI